MYVLKMSLTHCPLVTVQRKEYKIAFLTMLDFGAALEGGEVGLARTRRSLSSTGVNVDQTGAGDSSFSHDVSSSYRRQTSFETVINLRWVT